MPLDRHPSDVDLRYDRPAPGEEWDTHLIHTNYFGFTVPEAGLGAFVYVRCMPAFPLCHGGVCFWSGLDNYDALDADFFDYEVSMPWPEIDERSLTTRNGLRLEFVEPGRVVRLTYTSNDGETRMDVTANALTPMVARGHVMPGEEFHHGGPRAHGGMEQIMHYSGELIVAGRRHTVDAHDVRDRSWNQIRTERQGAIAAPPVCWTPMYFGGDLALNQVSPETHDTDPLWPEVYDIPAEKIRPVFGWTYSADSDEALEIVRTRRNVLEHHPVLGMPTRQELEIEDERGRVRHFSGEALSATDMPMWPNVNMRIAVYRWTDELGRETHSSTQEIWFDRYQRLLKSRRAATSRAGQR
jgi:hypothetical protein